MQKIDLSLQLRLFDRMSDLEQVALIFHEWTYNALLRLTQVQDSLLAQALIMDIFTTRFQETRILKFNAKVEGVGIFTRADILKYERGPLAGFYSLANYDWLKTNEIAFTVVSPVDFEMKDYRGYIESIPNGSFLFFNKNMKFMGAGLHCSISHDRDEFYDKVVDCLRARPPGQDD